MVLYITRKVDPEILRTCGFHSGNECKIHGETKSIWSVRNQL